MVWLMVVWWLMVELVMVLFAEVRMFGVYSVVVVLILACLLAVWR